MKNLIKNLLVGTLLSSLALHAQEQPVETATTFTNIDWRSASDVQVMLQAIQSLPTVSADSVRPYGNYYSAQHAPGTRLAWPPLPGNSRSVPVWDLGDGFFLLDDFEVDYSIPPYSKSEMTEAKSTILRANDVPSPGGGGGSGDGPNFPTRPDYGTNLWLDVTNLDQATAYLKLSNTVADIEYEIQYKTDLVAQTDWQSADWFVLGDETTNWTPLNLARIDTADLFFRVRSWVDSQGTGIPDWWWLQYGLTDWDPFANPSGDGYDNLEKFQNGMNPNLFYSPPKSVSNVQATATGTTNTVTWNSLPSATGYTVTRTSGTNVTSYAVGAGATSYTDAGAPSGSTYTVTANYSGGSSSPSGNADPTYNPVLAIDPEIVRGATPSDSSLTPLQIVLGGIVPTNVTAVRVHKIISPLPYLYQFGSYNWGYVWFAGDDGWSSSYPGTLDDGYFDVSISSFTNGVYQIPVSQLPEWCAYYLAAQPMAGGVGGATNDFVFARNVPFVDGSAVLKDNLSFILRTAQAGGTNDPAFWDCKADPNYAAVSPLAQNLETSPELFTELSSFTENNLMRNWAYDTNFAEYPVGPYSYYFFWLDKNLGYYGGYNVDTVKYQFNGYTYVNTQDAGMLASQLTNNPFIYILMDIPNQISLFDRLTGIGLSWNGDLTTHLAEGQNYYGLSYQSVRVCTSRAPLTAQGDIPAGGSYADPIPYDYSEYFQNTAAPELSTVDYYFAQVADRTSIYATSLSPMPNDGIFSVTNTTPLILAGVGQPVTIYGWAKQQIVNGDPTKFGYLGQYFDPTSAGTNGILSEYGDFMASQPEQITLKTKADPDQGGLQGSCVVNAISLNVDANHDGVMDLTYNGSDMTSDTTPFVFWINNDNDDTGVGQEVESLQFPDYSFGKIRSQRGLEDFARLWICGVPSLPPGYTATISCTALSGSPAINIYTAESGGGIGYLTNSSVASGLVGETKLGTVSSSSSYTFSSGFFDGSNKYFLFEGAGIGEGQFTLTISKDSTIIAQSSTYLDLRDVKTMYQRASATPSDTAFPPPYNQSGSDYTNNVFDESVLNYTQPNDGFPFQKPADETPQCVIFVHGWNMAYDEYLGFSETMFKRLYWQGYHGRFAAFQWATLTSFNSYNTSEFRAWKYGLSFKKYVENLKPNLSGYTMNVVAHSMGNVVVGSALHRGLTVDNYVLLQAALPAGCYDTSSGINSYQPLLDAESQTNGGFYHTTPDFANPDSGYRGYLTNVTGNLVNFFNTNDFALATGNLGAYIPFLWWISANWEANEENFKPDEFNDYLTYYAYFTNAPAGQEGQFLNSTAIVQHYVTDPHEMMSFVARPRSKAFGARGGIAGTSEVDLHANFGFDRNRDEHSAEFNWNVQRLGAKDGFYYTLYQIIR